MSTLSLRMAGALGAAVLAACSESSTGTASAARAPSTQVAVAGGQAAASVEWNAVARALVAKNRSNVFVAFRTYALVGTAQHEAVESVKRAEREGKRLSARAAVAGASAVALASVYPGDAAMLDSIVRAQVGDDAWLEPGHVDAARGETIGRWFGAHVVDAARTDRFLDPWNRTVPTGPGIWYSSATPAAPPAGGMTAFARPFFLRSNDQFRPAPPPAWNSPEFLAALAEVRAISDTRTREQDSIARFWAMGGGTYTPPGYWNARGAALAARHALNEARAARLFATLNQVAFDAIIASNDAKLAYWVLRPSQVDPAITLSITPLPNFPAYPSNHATISSAMAEVLAAEFPNEARELRAEAEQAALSRVYGGIHYRFDGDAGLELGRQVAAWALDKRAAREGVRSVAMLPEP